MNAFEWPSRIIATLNNYLSFVIDLSVPLGIVAEMVSGLLSYYRILKPTLFRRYRRYAVFASFTLAAILDPPDALSMILMGVAIYLVYALAHGVSVLMYGWL